MPTGTLPTYFISHGGGPWPWMKEQMHGAYDRLEAALQDMPRQLGATPKAVLMISGHWEEHEFTVMATEQPTMIYDYSGFPAHTYQVKYAAPGSPETAEKVRELIVAAGFPVQVDRGRGPDRRGWGTPNWAATTRIHGITPRTHGRPTALSDVRCSTPTCAFNANKG